MSLIFIVMNKIRKSWKDNGTPFFFTFNDGHTRTFLDQFRCSEFDKIQVQDDGCTAMDTLVDIRCVVKALDRCQDNLVISCVRSALSDVLNNLMYITQLKK